MNGFSIHEGVLRCLFAITGLAPDGCEFGAVLASDGRDDTARALWIPRQDVSPTHYRVEAEDLAGTLLALAAAGYPRLAAMVHSHVDMAVTPSATDHRDLDLMARLLPVSSKAGKATMRRGRGRSGASRVALPGGLDVAVSGLSRSGRVVVLHPLPGRASVCSLVLNRRGDMVALRAEIERCPCCAAVSVARDFVPVAVVREGRFHVPELERLRELMMANIIEEARTWKPWRLPIT